jgi:hypothetical protein
MYPFEQIKAFFETIGVNFLFRDIVEAFFNFIIICLSQKNIYFYLIFNFKTKFS